jgi:hypothetical protein
VRHSEKKRKSFTAEKLRALAAYDPETGIFTRREGGLGVRAGEKMGSNERGYWVIVIESTRYMAQRLAWLYVHGEWPTRPVRFHDGNKLNCAIANLRYGKYREREDRALYLRDHRKLHPEKYRGHDLKRSFGIDLAEYQRKFAAQGGVCAICAQPERDTRNGKAKWLAVDHDHQTGAVRDLLCCACNKSLGNMNEDPERLEKAAAYLRRHAAETPANVIRLKRKAP